MLTTSQFLKAFQTTQNFSATQTYLGGDSHIQMVRSYVTTYVTGPFDTSWTYGPGADAVSSPGHARNTQPIAEAWAKSPAGMAHIQAVAMLQKQSWQTGPLIQAIGGTGILQSANQAGVKPWFCQRIFSILFPEHFTTICTDSKYSEAKMAFGISSSTANINSSAQMLAQVDTLLQSNGITVPNDFFRALIAYFVV